MAHSPFLTTFVRHRDPKLLWPLAAVTSVLAHGVVLGLIRTLTLQTPALPEGEMAPLPIQLVTLLPDQPAPGPPINGAEVPSRPESATAEPPPVADAPLPMAAQTLPTVAPPLQPAALPAASPPVEPAPRPNPAPGPPDLPAVAPAPPQPNPALSPAPLVERPPRVESPPPVESPPNGMSPPMDNVGSGAGQGGQVVPVGIRLNPSGRDIPETAPQLLGTTAIEVRPLASSCGFANLEALLVGMTSASVQMQIRVEPSGDISDARLLQSTGSDAVDDLVSCVVKQRLRLQPATSAGTPQLTDAFILDARVEF